MAALHAAASHAVNVYVQLMHKDISYAMNHLAISKELF